MKSVFASPALSFVAPALVSLAIAPGAAWAQGSWSAVMDWSTTPPGNGQVSALCHSPHAFAHAALIPTGLYRGRVMLWHCAGGSPTQIWVFDPSTTGSGNVLSVVQQSVAGDIFCAGQSWDSSGRLVIAGGFQTTLDQCYRFDPAALGVTIPGTTPVLPGSPWTTLNSMAIARYYPTVIPLNRRTVTACGSSSLGSMNFVLGGPPTTAGTGPGNDIWELVPQPSAPPNGCYLAPATPAQFPSGNAEVYSETNGATGVPPETLLDLYPRAFQLNNDQVFIANDVPGDLNSHLTLPGQSWVINPRYGTAPQWDLTDGPNAGAAAAGQRYYGTAVLMHQRGAGKNRIFTFGGSHDTNYPSTPPAYAVNNSMQEFTPGVNGSGQLDAALGTWTTHVPTGTGAANIGRVHSNSVILPTGSVLILGGGSTLRPETPVFEPVLYTAGGVGTGNPGTAVLMATPNVPSGASSPTPRLYHSVAVLLQDGSVFLAGGENLQWPTIGGVPPPVFPHSDYTGEVFTPPYPSYRPTITSCPRGAEFSGSTFDVTVTPVQGAINRVVLLRPAAVTHHFDNDQRLIDLGFTTATSGSSIIVTVTPPPDTLGPAGWYLLFVLETGAQGMAPCTQGQFIYIS